MTDMTRSGLSSLEFHVLLALAQGPVHGYAIKDAVEVESQGALTPRAGSLYRVIARLMGRDLLEETEPPGKAEPHPGLARKYYGLTKAGREALAAETRRIRNAAELAEERLATGGGS